MTPHPTTNETLAAETFQARVTDWLHQCFGPEISADITERNHRFLEEALELVQSTGCTLSEAHQLVDYVFERPVGERVQELGGVMVTLAALCFATSLDMNAAAETELARVWTKIEKIRAKQAAKPKHSPLPALSRAPQEDATTARMDALHEWRSDHDSDDYDNDASWNIAIWNAAWDAALSSHPVPPAAQPEGEQRIPVDRQWCDYPIGTKAFAYGGGHWIRTEHGWQWGKYGGTFPTPGGDADGNVALPMSAPPLPAEGGTPHELIPTALFSGRVYPAGGKPTYEKLEAQLSTALAEARMYQAYLASAQKERDEANRGFAALTGWMQQHLIFDDENDPIEETLAAGRKWISFFEKATEEENAALASALSALTAELEKVRGALRPFAEADLNGCAISSKAFKDAKAALNK